MIFNILTAFIRLGRAGPVRGRVPSIFIDFVPSNPAMTALFAAATG